MFLPIWKEFNSVLDHIISFIRFSSLGTRLTLMSEYLLGGSFKLSLVAVCRIYFICDGKINNRSSNYWESGVYSSSVFDWVPSPPDPLSHWDLWSEQKLRDTGCVAAVSDGVVKSLIYLDKWAWWFINIYGRPKLYLETVPNFVLQPTPSLSSLTLTLEGETSDISQHSGHRVHS